MEMGLPAVPRTICRKQNEMSKDPAILELSESIGHVKDCHQNPNVSHKSDQVTTRTKIRVTQQVTSVQKFWTIRQVPLEVWC